MGNPDDIYLWADGVWCYRHELAEFSHKSDDHSLLREGTPEHKKFLEEQP